MGAYEARKHIAALSGDVELGQFDIGTSSIRIIRIGNLIQIVYSNKLEAKFLYEELFQRNKREQERLRKE